MSNVQQLRQLLHSRKNPEKAQIQQVFFKTGPGEYAEGDLFLGICVPELRKIAKNYQALSLDDVSQLVESAYHEERLIALFILILQYQRSAQSASIYDFYLQKMQYVNNWDLVDCSAPNIPGHYLFTQDKKILYEWAQHDNLWVRRISIVSTLYFIRQGQFEETLKLSEMLLEDKEDLLHKACGWMLREVGKQAVDKLEHFLEKYCRQMPRTMLRYSIEKFPQEKRKTFLNPILV